MTRLILTLDGAVIREYPVSGSTINIGRRHGNDIQLNDLTVSGRHAVVSTVGDSNYIEDLDSTNGTLVNGSRVPKARLKHGDVIQTGNFQFTFFTEDTEHYEPTMFIKAEIDDTQFITPESPTPVAATTSAKPAAVRVINGPLAGKVLELRKPFNTLGFNGVKMAIIARTPTGYTISGLKGSKLRRTTDTPLVNGTAIGDNYHNLIAHDVIELVGTRMEFFYPG